MGKPVILSYGLGWDSTAILLRWIHEPSSRDFDLSDLVVITAMTGDEFQSLGRLVQEHVLPLMAQHQIRFIQVARGGARIEDGVVILDDSREPSKLYLEGVYKLSDEMLTNATVPQFGGARLCSQKQKGVPLDEIIEKVSQGRPFRHVMGFNADEMGRVERDASYSTVQRQSEYPLVEWGWGRARLVDYVQEVLGIPWEKSCCTFCPFAGSCRSEKVEALTARYDAEPEAAMLALRIEHMALAMNVRQPLFAGKALRQMLEESHPVLVELWEDELRASPEWSLYRVRRSFRGVGQAVRSLEVLDTGDRGSMLEHLHTFASEAGVEVELTAYSPRAMVQKKAEDTFPTNEEMLVVAPAGVAPKENGKFEAYWVRTQEIEEARADDRPEPNPMDRAHRFVSEYVLTHYQGTFTKGEIQKAAGSYGVFTNEAGEAFDRIKDAGLFSKVGRRLTLSPSAFA